MNKLAPVLNATNIEEIKISIGELIIISLISEFNI